MVCLLCSLSDFEPINMSSWLGLFPAAALDLTDIHWSAPARQDSAWVQPRRNARFQPDFARPYAGAGDPGMHACAAQHEEAHDVWRLHRICHCGMVLHGRWILRLCCLRWAAPCSLSRLPALFACHRLGPFSHYTGLSRITIGLLRSSEDADRQMCCAGNNVGDNVLLTPAFKGTVPTGLLIAADMMVGRLQPLSPSSCAQLCSALPRCSLRRVGGCL